MGHTGLVGFDAARNVPALFSDFLFISAIWRDITVPTPANNHGLSNLYRPLQHPRGSRRHATAEIWPL